MPAYRLITVLGLLLLTAAVKEATGVNQDQGLQPIELRNLIEKELLPNELRSLIEQDVFPDELKDLIEKRLKADSQEWTGDSQDEDEVESNRLTEEILDWFLNPAGRVPDGIPNLILGKDNDTSEGDGGWDPVMGVYLPLLNPLVVSSECVGDVASLLRVWNDPLLMWLLPVLGQWWALRIPDSWGKFPDGYLYGNTQPWGMQEECTNTVANTHYNFTLYNITYYLPVDVHFTSRYCLVSYRGRNGTVSSSTVVRDQDQLHDQLTRVGSLIGAKPTPGVVRYGTCMPSTCTPKDLKDSIAYTVGEENIVELHVDCHMKNEKDELYAGDIVFSVILCIFLFLLLAAGTLDICINYFNKQELRKGPLRFLLVFSFYTNMKKIFHINNNESPEVISCLHGIRVLSMVWVVWGHSYLFNTFYSVNTFGIGRLTDDLLEQTITGGFFAVDTFFFISGLLVVYGLLREYKRTKRVNWILYYVHRFIRLTPPILFMAAFMATLSRLTLSGPMAGNVDRAAVQNCREHWWVDVLYLSNAVYPPCLGQCWYTAVDTQLYIIMPVVLVPLVYRRKIGVIVLAVLTLISMMIPMIINGVLQLAPNIMFPTTDHEPKADILTYDKPWIRATPYLVGMWTGLVLHKLRNKKIDLRPWQVGVGWVLSTVVGLLVVYGMVEYNTLFDPTPVPQGVSIVYEGFVRGSWGLVMGWVVFACHKGYAGPINSFLAHPCWQPLSRLTFVFYLTSMSIQFLYGGFIYVPIYVNHLSMFVNTCGTLFISGLVGIPLSLITEGPVLGLEKLLLRREGRGEQAGAKRTAEPS